MQTRRQYGGARHFNYKSETIHEDLVDGRHECHTKIVEIKNGKGVKRLITVTPSGKRIVKTMKLKPAEVRTVRRKIFIPNLFQPLVRLTSHK